MSPQFINSTVSSNVATALMPPALSAGDIVIVFAANDVPAGLGFTTPSGWTAINLYPAASGGGEFGFWYKLVGPSDSNTTVQFFAAAPGVNQTSTLVAVQYRRVNLSNPIASANWLSTTTQNGTRNLPTVTTQSSEVRLVYFAEQTGTTSNTIPTFGPGVVTRVSTQGAPGAAGVSSIIVGDEFIQNPSTSPQRTYTNTNGSVGDQYGTIALNPDTNNAPIHVRSAAATQNAAVVLPTGIEANDFMVAFANNAPTGTAPPAGWTSFGNLPIATDGTPFCAYYKFGTPADSGTSVTFTGSATTIVTVYRGVNVTTPLGNFQFAQTPTNPYTLPDLAISSLGQSAGALAIRLFGNHYTGAAGAGTSTFSSNVSTRQFAESGFAGLPSQFYQSTVGDQTFNNSSNTNTSPAQVTYVANSGIAGTILLNPAVNVVSSGLITTPTVTTTTSNTFVALNAVTNTDTTSTSTVSARNTISASTTSPTVSGGTVSALVTSGISSNTGSTALVNSSITLVGSTTSSSLSSGSVIGTKTLLGTQTSTTNSVASINGSSLFNAFSSSPSMTYTDIFGGVPEVVGVRSPVVEDSFISESTEYTILKHVVSFSDYNMSVGARGGLTYNKDVGNIYLDDGFNLNLLNGGLRSISADTGTISYRSDSTSGLSIVGGDFVKTKIEFGNVIISASSGLVPTLVQSNETFLVPENTQALFKKRIRLQDGGRIRLGGILIEV